MLNSKKEQSREAKMIVIDHFSVIYIIVNLFSETMSQIKHFLAFHWLHHTLKVNIFLSEDTLKHSVS